MLNFQIIQNAGISAAELALLVRYKDPNGEMRAVSRVAVYRWVLGHAKPSELLYPRVAKILSLLETAVEAGDLPLKLGTPRNKRKALIVQAIGKHLHQPQT